MWYAILLFASMVSAPHGPDDGVLDRGEVVAEEDALDLGGGELGGGLQQLVERGRHVDLGLLQHRLAVVEELRVVDHPDPVDLAVDRVRLDVGRVEVVLDRVDDVAQVGHLTALDQLQLRVELEDVGRLLGEQGREELGLEVVAGDPVRGHVGLGVRLRVPLDRLFRPGLAVGVEVLDEVRARTGAPAPPVVAAAGGQRRRPRPSRGCPEYRSAGQVAVAHCRHGDVLVSRAAAAPRLHG